jgi:manganese efflux pump family protein
MSVADVSSILLIALSLSADCFAVALGGSIGQEKLRKIQIVRTALAFGVAQTLMPVIGWAVGRTVIDLISSFDHWIALGLLLIIGGRMIWEAFHEKDEPGKGADISRGFLLLTLALATSLDALAVGLSFAFLEVNIVFASLIIGIIAFLITILGFYIGRKAGNILGQRAKIAGGIILIGIGIKVLLTHLLT